MSALLTRVRRRGAVLLTALAAVTFGLVGAGAAPAAAGPGPILTIPCYSRVCLYEVTVPGGKGLEAWSLLDVGPTPYYYSIFDQTTGSRIVVCGVGTTCTSGPIYLPYNVCHQYIAYIGGSGFVAPPAPVQRQSDPVWFCGPHLG